MTIGKLNVNCVIQVPSMAHFCSGGQDIKWEGVNFRFFILFIYLSIFIYLISYTYSAF